jgi:hypothetical protein
MINKKISSILTFGITLIISSCSSTKSSIQSKSETGVIFSCWSTRDGDLNKTPIEIATIKPVEDGYLIHLQSKDKKQNFEFSLDNSLKIISRNLGDGENINIEQGSMNDNNNFQVNPSDKFTLSFQYSSRTFCSFEGKMTFLEGAKERIFN